MDLFEEYERGRCAALYDAKLKALSVFYRAVRRIRGEGNCFYRSFWMGWIERMLENWQRGSSATSASGHPLLANPASDQWEKHIVALSDRAAESFKAAGADALEEELVISATPGFIEVTRGLCRGYADGGEPGLLTKARETDQTAKALRWLRLIASAHMRGKEEDFGIIAIGMGYDSLPAFCDAQVEADCSLADEPQITALTGALGIAVKVEYLDDVAYPWSSRCGPHRHVIRPLEASEASGDGPPIAACVLFRPGHYDLLIPRNWSEPALIEPDGEDESGGSRAGVGVAAETSGDGNGTRAVVAAVGAGLADSAPVEVIVTAFDPHHKEHGYEDNFFGLSCNDASKVVTPEGVGRCIVKFDKGKFAKIKDVTNEREHGGSKTGQKYVYIEPYEADHDGRPLRSLNRDGALRSLNRDEALRAGAKLTFFVPNIAPASPPDAFAAQRLHEDIERLEDAGYARKDCEQALRMCENNYELAARVLQDSRECERPQNPMSAAVQDVAEAAVGAAQGVVEAAQGMATTVSAAVQGVAKAAVGAAQGVVGAAQGMATTVAGAARMGVGAVVGNQSNQSFETDGAAVGVEHLARQEKASADAVHQIAAEEYDLQQRERLGGFLALISNDRYPDLHPDDARLAIRAQRTLYAGNVAQTEAESLDRQFDAFGLALEARFIPQEIEAIEAGAWPPHEYICKYSKCRRRFRTLEGQRWHEGSDMLSLQLNECVDWKKRGRLWAETYDKRNPQWPVSREPS